MGLIVDAVSDVLNIPTTDIQATPDFGGAGGRARSSAGWRKAGDKLVVLLLDIDNLLTGGQRRGSVAAWREACARFHNSDRV